MKKNCDSKAFFCVFFAFSILFNSCSESAFEPESNKINLSGKLSALLNIPVSDAIIKAGDKTTTSSSNGEFSLNDITIPYDLNILDTISKKGFAFKNTSGSYFNFILPYVPKSQKMTGLTISFPPGLLTSDGKAIFTDGNQNSFYSNDIDTNGTNISIYSGIGSSITGKVILILFTRDNAGNITSYDRYGEKDSITIISGVPQNINFTLNDLQLNPGEVTVSGSFTGLQGSSNVKYFFLTFGKRNTSGFMNALSFLEIFGNYFNLVLPTNLPSDFTPLILTDGPNTNGYNRQQFVLPKSGTGIILKSQSESPSLINPPDNATNVDTTTLFEWTIGSPDNGIYSLVISDSNYTEEYRMFTNSTSITLAELKGLGLTNFSNRTFHWYCIKYGTVNSLEEFLDPSRNNLEHFNTLSQTRNFRTK